MIKYCANYTFLEVKPVEVLEETDQCVWLRAGNGRVRAFKITSYDCYFDSRKEAVIFLRERAKRDLKYAREKVCKLEINLQLIDKLEQEG
jgi:hypothetical protein